MTGSQGASAVVLSEKRLKQTAPFFFLKNTITLRQLALSVNSHGFGFDIFYFTQTLQNDDFSNAGCGRSPAQLITQRRAVAQKRHFAPTVHMQLEIHHGGQRDAFRSDSDHYYHSLLLRSSIFNLVGA